MAGSSLVIKGLEAGIESRPILKGVDLEIKQGEIHAVMGPNGSGKSTLAYTLMGHPKYEVTAGEVLLDGENLLELEPDERAKRGLFLAFQYPAEIPGVGMANFLRQALRAVKEGQPGEDVDRLLQPINFRKYLKERMALLQMPDAFMERYLNEGFSGGERKKNEILQLAVLRPRFVIMDETDSGLDIDALRTVSEAVNKLAGPDMGVLVITHYQRILNYVKPHFVHIMVDGRIVQSGGPELALEVEETGYEAIRGAQAV